MGTVIDIGTNIQVIKEAGEVIKRVENCSETANEPLVIVAFDCVRSGYRSGSYKITMDVINNSGRNISGVVVSVFLDKDRVAPLINDIIVAKDERVTREILNVIACVSGEVIITSLNNVIGIEPNDKIRIQVEDTVCDINIDFRKIIGTEVGIKY
mgnify:CR=1 FL=1